MANNNTNKSSATNTDASYTAMAVGDVEAIGAHCQLEYCHQLDFLPFRCGSCRGTFCLDHRSETAHKCPKEGAWARARAQRDYNTGATSGAARPGKSLLDVDVQCASTTCKTLIDTALVPGIQCPTCNRRYCLKHRMKEDHDCANLKPLGARPATFATQQKERGLSALEKLRSWGASKKTSLEKSSASLAAKTQTTKQKNAAASQAALNALKMSAKGDAKVPPEKRVYLHVEASADTTKAKFPTGKFFYSKEWSVGRLLDAAAKALQVENTNNRREGEEEKLRVFHVEGGRLLEFSEKLGDSLVTGNTVILLRGVGPPVPDLIG